MPVADMFWGDRYGVVEDPFGHRWELATRKETLTPKQMAKRALEAMSGPPPAAT
jgi:PhnB protein